MLPGATDSVDIFGAVGKGVDILPGNDNIVVVRVPYGCGKCVARNEIVAFIDKDDTVSHH